MTQELSNMTQQASETRGNVVNDLTAPELKPCPFCGGKGHLSKDPDPDHGDFYCIKCSGCRSKSPEFHASETCPIFFGQVRDAWNTRADLCTSSPTDERVKALVDAATRLADLWDNDAMDRIGPATRQVRAALRDIDK